MTPKQSQKIDKLIKLMQSHLRDYNNGVSHDGIDLDVESALLYLLQAYQSCLPPLNSEFHKTFRVRDVTHVGHIDVVIYRLLNASVLFWQLFTEVNKRGPRPTYKTCPLCQGSGQDQDAEAKLEQLFKKCKCKSKSALTTTVSGCVNYACPRCHGTGKVKKRRRIK